MKNYTIRIKRVLGSNSETMNMESVEKKTNEFDGHTYTYYLAKYKGLNGMEYFAVPTEMDMSRTRMLNSNDYTKGQVLMSHVATDILNANPDLPGVAVLDGDTQVSTNGRYVYPQVYRFKNEKGKNIVEAKNKPIDIIENIEAMKIFPTQKRYEKYVSILKNMTIEEYNNLDRVPTGITEDELIAVSEKVVAEVKAGRTNNSMTLDEVLRLA